MNKKAVSLTHCILAMFFLSATLGRATERMDAQMHPRPPAPGRTTPVISTDVQVQHRLQALDQFLDVRPELERRLDNNLTRLDDEEFILHNPQWAEELQQQPGLAAALKAERNFLLHRIISREANLPLIRNDVLAFDRFLDAHADINRAVQQNPQLLIDGDFLRLHPPLADFYDAHPALSTILMEVGGKETQNPLQPHPPKQGE
jgi:hypothetical protein